jgi:hypothetical protein
LVAVGQVFEATQLCPNRLMSAFRVATISAAALATSNDATKSLRV